MLEPGKRFCRGQAGFSQVRSLVGGQIQPCWTGVIVYCSEGRRQYGLFGQGQGPSPPHMQTHISVPHFLHSASHAALCSRTCWIVPAVSFRL